MIKIACTKLYHVYQYNYKTQNAYCQYKNNCISKQFALRNYRKYRLKVKNEKIELN